MESKARKNRVWCWERVLLVLYGLQGILFLPILFCVIFIGNNMDYCEIRKMGVLLPGVVLFAAALVGGVHFYGCHGSWRSMR